MIFCLEVDEGSCAKTCYPESSEGIQEPRWFSGSKDLPVSGPRRLAIAHSLTVVVSN